MISPPHVQTPDDRFANIPDYPWIGQFVNDLPSIRGLRMHYLDEGPRDAPRTWLCLHGNPTWSYLYRKMIPVFLDAGDRVVAPDMLGFGKSDKPIDDALHTFAWHRSLLVELVERLDLTNINLVVQDWGGLFGLTLPLEAPPRYRGLLVMNTMLATADEALTPGFVAWRDMCRRKPEFSIARLIMRSSPEMSAEEGSAYEAPFPTAEFRAATRAFPERVPADASADGVEISRRAAEFWAQQWQGKSMMAVGMTDPVFPPEHMEALRHRIRGCPPALQMPKSGHFVQEQGREIAIEAVRMLA